MAITIHLDHLSPNSELEAARAALASYIFTRTGATEPPTPFIPDPKPAEPSAPVVDKAVRAAAPAVEAPRRDLPTLGFDEYIPAITDLLADKGALRIVDIVAALKDMFDGVQEDVVKAALPTMVNDGTLTTNGKTRGLTYSLTPVTAAIQEAEVAQAPVVETVHAPSPEPSLFDDEPASAPAQEQQQVHPRIDLGNIGHVRAIVNTLVATAPLNWPADKAADFKRDNGRDYTRTDLAQGLMKEVGASRLSELMELPVNARADLWIKAVKCYGDKGQVFIDTVLKQIEG